MTDILHATTPEEAYSYYHAEYPELTPEEAFRVMSRFQGIFGSSRLSREEKARRYSRYCDMMREIKSGNKTSLQRQWERGR